MLDTVCAKSCGEADLIALYNRGTFSFCTQAEVDAYANSRGMDTDDDDEEFPSCVDSCDAEPTSCDSAIAMLSTGCASSCDEEETGEMLNNGLFWMCSRDVIDAFAASKGYGAIDDPACVADCTAPPNSCAEALVMLTEGCAKDCSENDVEGLFNRGTFHF